MRLLDRVHAPVAGLPLVPMSVLALAPRVLWRCRLQPTPQLLHIFRRAERITDTDSQYLHRRSVYATSGRLRAGTADPP